MITKTRILQFRDRVLFFFPFQLLVLHLKKNHLTLLSWLLLFGYITQGVGLKYGIPYVFLYPEYFGSANIWSFLMLGFSVGGFITAFNLFTYTAHAYRFPVVATLARPFLKFNINNGIIPAAFVLTYLWCSARLQLYKELVPAGDVAVHLLGFLIGIGLFLLLALVYFTRTNMDVHQMMARHEDTFRPEPVMEDIIPAVPPQRLQQRKASRWLRRQQRARKWRVETYLTWPPRIALARSSMHYQKELLRAVLWQNHINGSIFGIAVVVVFLALGAFSDVSFFAIPAGASAFLLFTMLLLLFSALTSWMKGWMVTLVAVLFLTLHLLSTRTQKFLADAQAYGPNYTTAPAPYTREVIHALATDSATARRDAQEHLVTLERWLAANSALPHAGEKPPLIIINTSGGGSRAMLWTLRGLQVADSLLGGSLMQRTALMTGSSGGLIGAAYYRQLDLEARRGGPLSPDTPVPLERMAADILNPIAFSLVTNDMFIRYRDVQFQGRSYTLDRGGAFESRLDELTDGLFAVPISSMAAAERMAQTPMMVISPSILNDGRRLLISALPVSYLTNIRPDQPVIAATEPESIEYMRLFAGQDPGNLKLTSALRMSATFPYVTPVVTLPSKPKMRVMDAGVRDNFGYRTTLSFLYTFRHWLKDNVGRVVVIQMRDKQRELAVKVVGGNLIDRLTEPLGNIYNNVVKVQDQDYDLAVKTADAWMPVPLDIVDLQLWLQDDGEISLSWHLTALERKMVLNTIGSASNQHAFRDLQHLVLGPDGLSRAVAHERPLSPAKGLAPRP